MVVRRALGMSSLAEAEDRSLLRDSKAATGCSWSDSVMLFSVPILYLLKTTNVHVHVTSVGTEERHVGSYMVRKLRVMVRDEIKDGDPIGLGSVTD